MYCLCCRTAAMLKDALRARHQSISGNKSELIQSLWSVMEANGEIKNGKRDPTAVVDFSALPTSKLSADASSNGTFVCLLQFVICSNN